MIKINIIGFKSFQNSLNKLPANLRKETEAEIKLSAEQFRTLAIRDAPADVGFLRSQITVKKSSESQLAYEVVSGSKYSAPMEFGTKSKFIPIPGIDSAEFRGLPTGGTFKEMVNNIAKWVRRKGISGSYSVKTRRRTGNKLNQLAEDYQLAYLIARSIIKKGVTPHPFFFKQIPIVRRDFFRRYRNILNSILD